MIRRAQTGDPLSIRAGDWNALADMHKAHVEGKLNRPQPVTRTNPGDVVYVKNGSGAAAARWSVLALGAPLYSPTDQGEDFGLQIVFNGAAVSAVGEKFAVLPEPIADGAVGKAIITGVTAATVNVIDADHTHANIAAAATVLQSGLSGPCEIIWKESGTGSKFAIVRFGSVGIAGFFPVRVWRDGGSTDGSKTAQCNRTYTVRTQDATGIATGGTLLGATMTPVKRRPALGKLSTPAATGGGTIGSGYYDHTGDFQLYDANETLGAEACTEP